jgi:intracellular sulfur oxidation DsrE/DsrF family protein
MAELNVISLQELIDFLPRKPGIVFGPDVTSVAGAVRNVYTAAFADIAAAQDKVEISDVAYRSALDLLAEDSPEQVNRILSRIRDGIMKLPPPLDLSHLVKAGWSSCISLTEDLLFESALRNYLDGRPTSLSATIIDSNQVLPPERTIPIYKLLGNVNSRDEEAALALSESDMLLRQQTWPQILRTFPDYLRDSPLLFIGTSSIIPMVRLLLSTLLGMSRPNVGTLLFLRDDPTLKDATIRKLVTQRKAYIVDASLRDISAAITHLKPRKPISFSADPDSTKDSVTKVLNRYESLVSVVPHGRLDPIEVTKNLLRLTDSLFRPAVIDWQPFLAGLDLRRSITDELIGNVTDILSVTAGAPAQAIVVHGEAGIGKTIALKRTAIELAEKGLRVIWCRRTLSGNYLKGFRELASEVNELLRKGDDEKGTSKPDNRLVIFCDDPWALRIDPIDLMACFDRFAGRIAFVFSVRNSDYFAGDGINLLSAKRDRELELPYKLDSKESSDLQGLLMRIGVVKDLEQASQELARLGESSAKDILCSLWFLIPETRSQLSDSLRDEYCRLGDISDPVTSIASSINTGSVAHKAYEFVTVTSSLDIPLPIEVLVRALKVDYQDWLDMTVNGRPLWGLLYDEVSEDGSTVVFRTRNNVVTKILLELVNGGVGHAGEIRILKDLLRACSVGTPIYRSFVIDILVRSGGKLHKILDYDGGIELFDIAREALPHSDRVVEHHKGIWMHKKGHDYKNAYSQYEQALNSLVYPGAERDAPVQHIHTSMAAAVVQMIRQGEQDRTTGVDLVRNHLRHATSATFFNLHTAHISANLLFELAQQGEGSEDAVSLSSLSEAMHEIEKAFQSIGAHTRGYSRHEKDVVMLNDLLTKILGSIPDTAELQEIAIQRFLSNGEQQGFEVAARRMLAEANQSSKGRDYNKLSIYLDECIELIISKNSLVSVDLIAVRVDLVVRWRIQRKQEVDWYAFLTDLDCVFKHTVHRDSVMKQFYYAVALFHCSEITEANARFASLRRLQLPIAVMAPREIRCYYLNATGTVRRFQGVLERGNNGIWYLRVADIDHTIPCRQPGGAGGHGSTVHAYIGFALNGPIGVFDKPGEMEGMLS